MLKKVLVALDGSARAETAIPWERILFPDAETTLLRVVDDLCEGAADQSRERAAELYLRDLARSAGKGMKTCVRVGSPAHMIQKTAEGLNADLIAMTTHGRSSTDCPMIGGIVEQVLYGAHVPLLIVPSHDQAATPGQRIRTVLAPLDGSALSEAIVPLAADLARRHVAGLVLAHVFENSSANGLRQRIERLAERLKESGVSAAAVMARGPAPETILALAREQAADAIVMSAHGHGGLQRMMFGSVTIRVIRRTYLPVITARGPALKRIARWGRTRISERS